jgi:uncharacterized membrane protein
MAGPGEPPRPNDDDDLVGFSSPASLEARPSLETQAGETRASDPDDLFEPGTPGLAEPAIVTPAFAAPSRAEPEATPAPAAAPVSAGSIFEPSREFSTRRRGRKEDAPLPEGATGLFTTYALILFAVPTLGVSLLIALLFLRGRTAPDEAVAGSHHDFQNRTVMAGVAAGIVGIVLIAAPFAVGVPVLFLLAIWILLRGARGVLTLKDHRPIRHPRGWWI